jgi:hypothetical protein
MLRAPCGFAIVATLALTSPAAADSVDPHEIPPAEGAPQRKIIVHMSPGTTVPARWYGWQIMLADLAAGLTFALGVQARAPAIMYASGAIYVLGGPSVHAAHSNDVSLGLDLGMRLMVRRLLLVWDGQRSRDRIGPASISTSLAWLGASSAR